MNSEKLVIEYNFDRENKKKIIADVIDFTATINVNIDNELLFSNNIFVLDLVCQLCLWLKEKNDFIYNSNDDPGEGLKFVLIEKDIFKINSDWSFDKKEFLMNKTNLIESIEMFIDKFKIDFEKRYNINVNYFIKKYYNF